MYIRRTVGWCALVAALGCARPDAAPGVGTRDDFGDTVAVSTARRRIVSLNPTTTELLFALGAGDRVVGRTEWDQWPDSARHVPSVGPGLRPNVEAVLARHPDLVVLYASADNRAAAARFRAAGVATLALKIDRIHHFRRAAEILGALTGADARAREIVDSVDATLERVRAATRTRPRRLAYWHVWDAPVITIGGGSYLTELVEIAGGTNVYGDVEQPSMQVALEDVVRRNPDVVIAGPEGARRIAADPAWRAVPAVRDGRVVVVDTALVGRPSIRLGEAAVDLARLLHPEVRP